MKELKNIRVGCSGWSYDDWRGRFYPKELKPPEWFAHYAKFFDTVEINNTFYHLPPAQTFKTWHAQAPDGFIYAVCSFSDQMPKFFISFDEVDQLGV